MVVCYKSSVSIHESLSVTRFLCRFPNLLIYVRSKFFRIPFFHKHTAFTSYHIEQDTKTCIISLYMRITCPILRSQTPEFLLMLSCIKLWRTIVLCIQQNDINPQFRLLLIDQTSYFEQSSYPTGTIICTQNRSFMVLLVRIVISPWACIPMCKQSDSLFTFRLIRTDNVSRFQQRTVISNQISILISHLSTESL